MEAASLAAAGNYAIGGASILSAKPGADRKSVALATGALFANRAYVLAVVGVRDLAGDAIAPGTRVPFKTQSTVLAINFGGAAFTGADGTSYLADQYFTGGAGYATGSPIASTSDDAIYQSVRYGNFAYSIPIANGSYFVTLKCSEIYWSANARRVFTVTVEGNSAVTDLDIYARVGANAAYDITVPVTIADGVLDLGVIALRDQPNLSGIVITDAPAPFTDFPSWQSFYFGSPAASGAAAGADPDGDGLDNAREFLLGSDPTVADAALFAPTLSLDSAKLTLTYRKGAAGLSYRVQWSATLAPPNWSAAGVENEVPFSPTDTYRRSVPILPGETRKFLRLEIGP